MDSKKKEKRKTWNWYEKEEYNNTTTKTQTMNILIVFRKKTWFGPVQQQPAIKINVFQSWPTFC